MFARDQNLVDEMASLVHLDSGKTVLFDCDNVLKVYQDHLLASYCLIDSRFHKLSQFLCKATAAFAIKHASIYGL